MKSDSKLVTAAVLARALGLSDSRIVSLRAEGLPYVETQAGLRFDLTAAMRWYVSRKVESARTEPVGAGGAALSPVDVARVRKLEIGVSLGELELARKLGEVVSIDLVITTVAQHVAAARSRLLAMPSRLAPLLAVASGPAECHRRGGH